MDFNAIDVAQGNCKELGTPRTDVEAFATFNLGISASVVRKLSKAGYETIEDYQRHLEGYTKDGCENWEELSEFEPLEVAEANLPQENAETGEETALQEDASDDVSTESDEVESQGTDTVSDDAEKEVNSDETSEPADGPQDAEVASTDETVETPEVEADAATDTAPVSTGDPVKDFLKANKVRWYALFSPKVALEKAIELGYQA